MNYDYVDKRKSNSAWILKLKEVSNPQAIDPSYIDIHLTVTYNDTVFSVKLRESEKKRCHHVTFIKQGKKPFHVYLLRTSMKNRPFNFYPAEVLLGDDTTGKEIVIAGKIAADALEQKWLT